MEDDRSIAQIISKIIIAFIGTFGIVELASYIIKLSTIYVGLLALLFSTFFVMLFYMDIKLRNKILLPLAIFVIMSLFFGNSAVNGFIKIYCRFKAAALYYSEIVLPGPEGIYFGTEGTFSEIVAVVLLIVILSYLVSIEVCVIRSFTFSIILVLPVFMLFVGFSVIPGVLSMAFCLAFIYGVATLRNKNYNPIASGIVIFVSLIIALLSVISIPRFDYKKPQIFQDLYSVLYMYVDKDGFNRTDNSEGLNYISDTNKGKLGQLDSIEYENKVIANITTANTGDNQYIKDFTGLNYNENAWSVDYYENDLETYTKKLFVEMDYDYELRLNLGIDDEDYYKKFMTYKYIFTKNDQVIEETVNYAAIDYKDYAKFDKISTLNSRWQVEDRVKNKYLSVPVEVKQTISEVIDTPQLYSTEDKLEYIQTVRDYLKNGYSYTLSPGKVPEGKDFVTYFLTESKRGYCTYFATAATLIFRNAGIPARYCEGYVLLNKDIMRGEASTARIDRLKPFGSQIIISVDMYNLDVYDNAAHAWVEVYVDGYGWIPVEVTPSYSFEIEDNSSLENMDEEPSYEDSDDSDSSTQEEETKQEDVIDTEQSQIINPNNIVNIDFRIIIGIIILLAIIGIIAVNIRRHRRKEQMFSYEGEVSVKFLQIYEYIEKLLAAGGYIRSRNMDYEDFVYYLSCRNIFFDEIDLKQVVEIVLRVRFSNQSDVSVEEFNRICILAREIKRFILSEGNIYENLITVVIKGL